MNTEEETNPKKQKRCDFSRYVLSTINEEHAEEDPFEYVLLNERSTSSQASTSTSACKSNKAPANFKSSYSWSAILWR